MERRSETRIEHNLDIFVHVCSCEENPELVGVSIRCEATDFSQHGLRYKSDLLLSTGTLVSITIGIEHPFSMYLLSGVVLWGFELDGKMVMGIHFREGERNELKRWIEAFDSIFEVDSATLRL